MLTGIQIESFRGFEELDLELLPLSVLVGPNSSGKTSVLRAIRLALEALALGLEESPNIVPGLGMVTVCSNLLVRDHARLYPISDFAELFSERPAIGPSAMGIHLRFEETDAIQNVHANLQQEANRQLFLQVLVTSKAASDLAAKMPETSPGISDRLREFLRGTAPKALFVPAFYGVIGDEEYRTRASMSRSLGGSDQSRIVRNIIARLDGRAFGRLSDFLRLQVGASLVKRTADDDIEDAPRLEVFFRDTNGDLELSSAGAGLINLIALRAIMEWFRPGPPGVGGAAPPVVYLLDEPEAHLHPKLQGDVGEALAATADEFRAQLLVATHSVEMINRLARHPGAALFAVDRITSTATRLDSETALLRELGKWCDLSPFASLNFLASRRILFHEGPSDATILQRCAEALFRTRAPDLAAFRRWTLVSLDGVGKVKAQGVLGAVLSPTLFPGLSEKEVVRAVCVQDRDTERQPGFRTLELLTREHFDARELVWSRHSIESLFLEPQILAMWIRACLPADAVPLPQLQEMVTKGIERANDDRDLNDEVEGSLQVTLMRTTKKRPEEALKEAKQQIRAEPQVFQKGRPRASFVLGHVRDALTDNRLKNALPTSIQGLLERASLDRLGDRAASIPLEIRELLEHMIRSALP